jgi:type IV secretory pathway VirB3-like protein
MGYPYSLCVLCCFALMFIYFRYKFIAITLYIVKYAVQQKMYK